MKKLIIVSLCVVLLAGIFVGVSFDNEKEIENVDTIEREPEYAFYYDLDNPDKIYTRDIYKGGEFILVEDGNNN